MSSSYTAEFFANQQSRISGSVSRVVPVLLDYIPRPISVVDVGCGTGDWLAEFQRHGAQVLGLDGPYIDRSRLQIPVENFMLVDLSRPLKISRRFDLAVCLELAEHLSKARAPGLVADICALSDRALFSAAAPGQGGTSHVNEQWPAYWQELFRAQGFEMVDILRNRIWEDNRIAPYYRQNLFVCLKGASGPSVKARLHHEIFGPPSIRQSITLLMHAIRRRLSR